jgi:hypothetical protein
MLGELIVSKTGIDIDTNQWGVVPKEAAFWGLVAAAGHQFAYLRLTKGDKLNQTWAVSANDFLDYGRYGKDAGLEMGLIHVFDPSVDGARQTDCFNSLVRKLRRGYKIPVQGTLMEWYTQAPTIWLELHGFAESIRENLDKMLRMWKLLQLPTPRLAFSLEYFQAAELHRVPGVAECSLWIIDPSESSLRTGKPPIPKLWKAPQLWQQKDDLLISDTWVGKNLAFGNAIPTTKKPGGGSMIAPLLKLGPLAVFLGLGVLAKWMSKQPKSSPERTPRYTLFHDPLDPTL